MPVSNGPLVSEPPISHLPLSPFPTNSMDICLCRPFNSPCLLCSLHERGNPEPRGSRGIPLRALRPFRASAISSCPIRSILPVRCTPSMNAETRNHADRAESPSAPSAPSAPPRSCLAPSVQFSLSTVYPSSRPQQRPPTAPAQSAHLQYNQLLPLHKRLWQA